MLKYLFAFLLTLLLSFVFFYEALLKQYALFFEVDTAQKGADAILVLGGSPYRCVKASELLKSGYAPKIYLSEPRRSHEKEYDFMLEHIDYCLLIFQKKGIEDFEIIKSSKGGATSTLDEAYDFINFAKEHNITRAVIVTDSFHARRAKKSFEKIAKKMGTDIEFQVSALKNDIYDETNWYKTEAGITDYALESIKTFVYLFVDKNIDGIKEQ